MTTRRTVLRLMTAAAATPALCLPTQAATPLKISHQFPGGTETSGDFRDQLCRRFAAELTKRSNGDITTEVYPGSSLMKDRAQFGAMRKGALDLSLYPMPYAGGEVPETNIGLMPCLVTSYAQGIAWKKSEAGKMLAGILADKGIIIVTWVWQAGGVASRDRALVAPEDAKGMKVRGGSREFDMMLQAAGAATLTVPSSELYQSMQTGACDAGVTSSTSLISFRLEELSKHLTSGRGKSFWFMLEPLLMSKIVFDGLPKPQQELILTIGAELETFGTEAAKADDARVVEIYQKAGAQIHDMDAAIVEKWAKLARETAWKDFAEKSESSKKLLELALKVT